MSILTFMVGVVLGMCAAFFMIGTTRPSRENEIYMDGFNAGQKSMQEYNPTDWEKNIIKRFERVD